MFSYFYRFSNKVLLSLEQYPRAMELMLSMRQYDRAACFAEALIEFGIWDLPTEDEKVLTEIIEDYKIPSFRSVIED